MEGNGICSAAFCESAALQGKVFAEFQRTEPSQSSLRDASSPKGGASGETAHFAALVGNFAAMPRALPLGELAR